MTFDEWQTVKWERNGIAENPEHQSLVDEWRAACASSNMDAIRAFIESLGVPWLDAARLVREKRQ